MKEYISNDKNDILIDIKKLARLLTKKLSYIN